MAGISPRKKVDEHDTAGARPHGLGDSQSPRLDHAGEQELCAQIQEGTAALDALDETVAICVIPFLQNCNSHPLSVSQLIGSIRELIREELVTCSGSGTGAAGYAQKLPYSIQERVTEQLKEADLRGDANIESWIDTELMLDGLEENVSTKLFSAVGQWEKLERREGAIKKLVQSHLMLARPFAMRAMHQPFEFDDLMNEAFFILRGAAERFDPCVGVRFSSYAQKALHRELKRRSPSRIGLTRQSARQLRELSEAQRTLSQQQQAAASADSAYAQLGWSKKRRTEIENVRRILSGQVGTPLDPERVLAELKDKCVSDPATKAGDQEYLALLPNALAKLTPLEKSVVIRHCVLGTSFRQMAKEDHKSAKTLRDVCYASLEKLARLIDSTWTGSKPR